MKRIITILLCGLLTAGVFGGCGRTAETEKPQEIQGEQGETMAEELATFNFTKDEFVTLVDERMTSRDRKLLSAYPVETKEVTIQDREQMATTYLMDEKVTLTIYVDNEKGNVSNISFYETFDILSGEALDDYTALLINSLIVLEPEKVQDIVDKLGLEGTEETTNVAEGTNGMYMYTVKDGVAILSIYPN